jgi:hypothetical protein
MLWQVIQVAVWFPVLIVLMSLIEHQVHQRLMHKKPRFLFFRRLAVRNKIFTHHAVDHHGQYRKIFHDAPSPHGGDRGIRLNVWEGLVESLPVSLLLICFSITAALMFPLVVCLHHVLWNQVHMEMHKPANRFFANWPIYKFVARHHFLHHRHPDKNFNVALPIGDFLFGTIAKPTDADRESMKAERWFVAEQAC